ncbi:DNA repair and recombination protein RAD54B-like isoform X2 [Artemia franciscana]
MRRSLAPSQLPFKEEGVIKRSPSSILALISKSKDDDKPPPMKRMFEVPVKNVPVINSFTIDEKSKKLLSDSADSVIGLAHVSNDNVSDFTQSSETLYFSAVWGKQSNRKHKKWEGDGVLVVSKKCVTLIDSDGKELGKLSNSKLKTFESGERFYLGSREVEILDPISQSDFLKGRCFERCQPSIFALKPPRPAQFQLPVISGNAQPIKSNILKPRHNPEDKGAIVLPRPDSKVQFNSSTRIVDVVIDPFLGRHLRKHQIDGVIFMYECVMGFRDGGSTGCILADSMGLGKTLQSITLIWTMLHQGPFEGKPIAKRVMIIAPSSLVHNWEKEFQRWLGRERLLPFVIDNKNKPTDYAKQFNRPVMIISYELFVRNAEIIEKIPFDLVVCDEAHRMKNLKVKKSESLARLDCGRRIFLTGTPIQNDLSEFFALADIVNPGILGRPSAFKRIFEDPINASRLPDASEDVREIGEMRAQELNEIISKFVLRRTQDMIKEFLPPKIENVVLCKTSQDQAVIYEEITGCKGVRSIFIGCYSGCAHLYYISLLRNLCNHPSLCNVTGNNEEDERDVDFMKLSHRMTGVSTKLEVLKKMLITLMEEGQEKMVIVSYFTKTLDLISEHLKALRYTYLRLDGQTKVSDRQVIVDRFNRPDTERLFLLSSKAGGVGLNLIGASRIVLYDIDWNPANDEQAMARVWRDGQKRVVHIYRLLNAGTIEEKIFQRQIVKQGLSNSVVDAQELDNQKFGVDELRDIFSFKRDIYSDTHDLLNCNCEGDGTVEVQERAATPIRACQLGTVESDTVKNKNISQLLEWQHFQTPFCVGLDDTLLHACRDLLTFVFRKDYSLSE